MPRIRANARVWAVVIAPRVILHLKVALLYALTPKDVRSRW